MKVKFSPALPVVGQDGEKANEPSESDKLLFNPCEDELNKQWVYDMLLSKN